jgi:hypothetical protein
MFVIERDLRETGRDMEKERGKWDADGWLVEVRGNQVSCRSTVESVSADVHLERSYATTKRRTDMAELLDSWRRQRSRPAAVLGCFHEPPAFREFFSNSLCAHSQQM